MFLCIYLYNTVVSSRFVFIIGTSVVLAFRSMQRKGVSRLQLVRKITWRTVVLLMLGFCFLNYSPRDGPRKCKICSTNETNTRYVPVLYFLFGLYCGYYYNADSDMSNSMFTFYITVISTTGEHHWLFFLCTCSPEK